jgi:antirestriction protein ArdC
MRGERDTTIFGWFWLQGLSKKGVDYRYRSGRDYTIYNVEQCSGLRVPPLSQVPPTVECAAAMRAESVVRAMPDPPRIDAHPYEASYCPLFDQISMPPYNSFRKGDGYYATLFHELVHASGHPRRLKRRGVDPFGFMVSQDMDDYSQEELVAEMGAALLSAEVGIDCVEASAAYIESWLTVLREDHRMLLGAAEAGQKAANYILGRPIKQRQKAASKTEEETS